MISFARDVFNGEIRDQAAMRDEVSDDYVETLEEIDPDRMERDSDCLRDEDCVSDDNWVCGTLDPET